MAARQNRTAIAAALVVCGMLFAFAGDGLVASFTPDNMRELYVAWTARGGSTWT